MICCGRPLLRDGPLIITYRGLRGVLRFWDWSNSLRLLNWESRAESNSPARRKLSLAMPKLLISPFKPPLVWRINDLISWATSRQGSQQYSKLWTLARSSLVRPIYPAHLVWAIFSQSQHVCFDWSALFSWCYFLSEQKKVSIIFWIQNTDRRGMLSLENLQASS